MSDRRNLYPTAQCSTGSELYKYHAEDSLGVDMQFRNWRVITICLVLSLVYNIIIAVYLPFRALPDEANVAPDIFFTLSEYSLRSPGIYASGPGYPAFFSILLKILNFQYPVRDLLSPFITSVAIIVLVILALGAFGRHRRTPVAIGIVTLAVYSMPSFISRFRQTSHKMLTFILCFSILFVLIRSKNRNHIRYAIIAFTGLVAMSFINLFWAVVYAGVVSIAGITTLRIQKKPVISYIPILAIVFSICHALYSPLVSINIRSIFRGFVLGLLTNREVRKEPISVADRASEWPAMDLGIVSLPYGWIFSLGIIFLGLLGFAAVIHIFYNLIKNGSHPRTTISGVIIVTGAVYATLFLGLVVNGGLPTAARIIAIPAIFGVIYWIIAIEDKSIEMPASRRQLLASLLIVLLITSGLSVPRLIVDGQVNPADFTADSADLSRYQWVTLYNSTCAQSYHRADASASVLTQTDLEVKGGSPPKIVDVVYDNSKDPSRQIIC